MEPRKAAFERVLPNPKAKLLDQVREVCRLKHYSLRTEQSYVAWALRFLVFVRGPGGQWRHPRELGSPSPFSSRSEGLMVAVGFNPRCGPVMTCVA